MPATLSVASLAVAVLGACGGGGGDAAQQTTTSAGGSVAAPAPAPAPPPAGAVVYYFSDCQAGAAAGCVPGNNANAGTQASPRRDLSGTSINALPAGSHLLFNRGGAWNWRAQIVNLNATPTNPIVFDAYGSGPAPLLRTASGIAFEFGAYDDNANDGGYTLRNLRLDGAGTGQWGAYLRGELRNVTFDGVEISGFEIGIHTQGGGASGVTNTTIRNSNIHSNRDHGLLGAGSNFVMENNRIANNNPSGGGFEHGAYLSAGSFTGSGRIVGNTFVNNSAPGGVCDGGNLTMHGRWDGVLIEGNTITQTAATGGCYGMSITTGYDTAEFFRNVIVRGNTIVNVGHLAIAANASPNIVVENNKIRNTQATYQIGVGVGGVGGPGDAVDSGAIVRNNMVCFTQPASGSVAVRSTAPGATEAGTVYQVGAAATTGACAP